MTHTVTAKVSSINYSDQELKDLKAEKPEFFPTFQLSIDQEFIDELNDFCEDHKNHFDCLPTVFEWNGYEVEYDDFIKFIK